MSTNNNAKAFKSGIWYTAANFLTKSIGIITAPLFNRLLTKAEVGDYGNYVAWLAVFTILVTLNLESTFISARFDYEKEFDSYASSMLVFSTVSALIWMILLNVFSGFAVQRLGIEHSYINCMCVYLLFLPAVHMFQTKERYRYGYKKSVLISCLVAVGTALLSVILVKNMDNGMAGRVLGSALPSIVVGMVLYVILMRDGKKVKLEHIRYALPICLPFVPHLLSMTFLNSLDKIMITDIRGKEENALYTVAYQCSTVVTILLTSLNTAFSPWLGEKLHQEEYDEIRSVTKKYVLLFVYLTVGIMLFSPELILIVGDKPYLEAMYVMPPVMFGCVCQFVYTLYVNVEQFKKKTVGMAIASASAALLNYGLNALLIPKYGYIAAAYTTLISFLWLLIAHMFLVHRLGFSKTYPNKFIIGITGVTGVITVCVNYLYQMTVLRLIILAIYAGSLIYVFVKYKDVLLRLLKKKAAK